MSSIEVTAINSKAALTPPAIRDVNDVEIIQGCRAWVNFNGTGTVAIRNSFNVSSITDNGAGDYAVNFTNSMPSDDFATIISSVISVDTNPRFSGAGARAVGTVHIICEDLAGGALDFARVDVSVFSN